MGHDRESDTQILCPGLQRITYRGIDDGGGPLPALDPIECLWNLPSCLGTARLQDVNVGAHDPKLGTPKGVEN